MTTPQSSIATPTGHAGHQRIKHRLVLAAILVLLGFLLGPGAMLFVAITQVGMADDAVVFETPGTLIYHADKPGNVFIWLQTRGVIGGKVHAQQHSLPEGLQVSAARANSGEDITIVPANGMTMSIGMAQREAVFQFSAPTSGDYEITATGGSTPSVLAVSRGITGGMLGMLFGTICSALIGFALIVGGIVLGITTFVRRSKLQLPPQ
jgi:hypothetical protein